jgi:hypothetical protein
MAQMDCAAAYLGATHKDGLAARETDAVRRNKQRTWVLVGPDYFIADGCFALPVIQQKRAGVK